MRSAFRKSRTWPPVIRILEHSASSKSVRPYKKNQNSRFGRSKQHKIRKMFFENVGTKTKSHSEVKNRNALEQQILLMLCFLLLLAVPTFYSLIISPLSCSFSYKASSLNRLCLLILSDSISKTR